MIARTIVPRSSSFASPEQRIRARAGWGSIREQFAVPATRNGVSRYRLNNLFGVLYHVKKQLAGAVQLGFDGAQRGF